MNTILQNKAPTTANKAIKLARRSRGHLQLPECPY